MKAGRRDQGGSLSADSSPTLPDAYRLLHTGAVQGKPEWSDQRRNFKVEVEGRDAHGRRSRLVLALRPNDGALVLVTIHEVR